MTRASPLCLRQLALALLLAGASCTVANPDFRTDGARAHDTGGSCTPQCAGRQCGLDGCGSSCGECGADASCEPKSGACIPTACKPSCAGRQCGPNSCGGSCGDCPPNTPCSDGGQCLPACQPQCAQRECGADSCGGSCGECTPPAACASGKCSCSCLGKQCGPNGCGGSCGTCPPPATCDATGHCQAAAGCGAVTYQGCCSGSVVKYCQNSQLFTEDCSKTPQCGWNSTKKLYTCSTGGQAEPSGKFPKSCP